MTKKKIIIVVISVVLICVLLIFGLTNSNNTKGELTDTVEKDTISKMETTKRIKPTVEYFEETLETRVDEFNIEGDYEEIINNEEKRIKDFLKNNYFIIYNNFSAEQQEYATKKFTENAKKLIDPIKELNSFDEIIEYLKSIDSIDMYNLMSEEPYDDSIQEEK